MVALTRFGRACAASDIAQSCLHRALPIETPHA